MSGSAGSVAGAAGTGPASDAAGANDHLVLSSDPNHPANQIPALCAKFWTLGWVTGTGGGVSIRDGDLVYVAPSGVQKELMQAKDLYVLSLEAQAAYEAEQARAQNVAAGALRRPLRTYVRSPVGLKPSQCTPLFLAAFTRRRASCCIHTHSQWAVLVTLLLEHEHEHEHGHDGRARREFRINNMEQIKGFGRGFRQTGNLGYHDTLCIPVIENTPQEEDLTPFLEKALDDYPDTYAVLVRRHGVYVWGDTVAKAKVMAECYDYLFQLAIEMKKLGLPWISDVEKVKIDGE